ncbi:ribosomal protein S18-alanine N-acetyltransferase [Hwanghaeella sp. 1Z406]|jgi:[ribosomal protein S18]-alanine N-acetyltransferase|uniref:ribosomal protein S18-alanine N-acetyltransferase n=1 Tax=Hwanghaeella sp. 1Z406 TaxID=3402811 RepID=UPI003B67F1CA
MTRQPPDMPRKGIRITPIGVEGFRVIAALYALAFDDPWPEPSVRELLSVPGTWGLIALQSVPPKVDHPDDPVGFILARIVMDEAEILSIGVPPQWRKAGIGKALLSIALIRAQENGAKQVFLEVGKDNPAALALYSHMAFKQVGLRKKYYRRSDGTFIDALVMQKRL